MLSLSASQISNTTAELHQVQRWLSVGSNSVIPTPVVVSKESHHFTNLRPWSISNWPLSRWLSQYCVIVWSDASSSVVSKHYNCCITLLCLDAHLCTSKLFINLLLHMVVLYWNENAVHRVICTIYMVWWVHNFGSQVAVNELKHAADNSVSISMRNYQLLATRVALGSDFWASILLPRTLVMLWKRSVPMILSDLECSFQSNLQRSMQTIVAMCIRRPLSSIICLWLLC